MSKQPPGSWSEGSVRGKASRPRPEGIESAEGFPEDLTASQLRPSSDEFGASASAKGSSPYPPEQTNRRSRSSRSSASAQSQSPPTQIPVAQDATSEQQRKENAGMRVGASPVSDVAATKDRLHFQPYVDAVAAFLYHEDTQPPVTMSVEGEWGSGKSSFMQLIERRLDDLRLAEKGNKRPRGHVSVRFNAWRHDKQDAMWAAFALCLTTQVRSKQTAARRFRGDLHLAVSRLTTIEGWIHVGSAALLWIVLVLASCSAAVYLFTLTSAELHTLVVRVVPLLAEKTEIVKAAPNAAEFSTTITNVASKHAWLAILLILALGWRWIAKHLGTRLDWKLERYLNKPNYESHTAFIESFHQDFIRIVNAYARNDRVFVFVDDLDRCDIPRAADLMQALNLMIGDDPHLIFIIGMDREKIASGIALKYKDVSSFLRTNPGGADNPTARHPAAFGYSYLEKFIQITFRVPRPSVAGIDEFLHSLSGSQEAEQQAASVRNADQAEREARRQLVDAQARVDSPEVASLVKIVAPVLDWNPRRIKQFLNGLRLYAYVASDLGLLDIIDPDAVVEKRVRLTLEQLGKFIAITLTWPDLVMDLVTSPGILADIYRARAAMNTSADSGDSYRRPNGDGSPSIAAFNAAAGSWSGERLLVYLLLEGVSGADGWRYSLENADLKLLLNISRREDRRSKVSTPSSRPAGEAAPDQFPSREDSVTMPA